MTSVNQPAKGEAVPETWKSAVDPLLILVRAYQAAFDHFNQSEAGSEDERRSEVQMHWLAQQLANHTPECWTAEGAREALLLVASEMGISIGGFHVPVTRRVKEFLEVRENDCVGYFQLGNA